MILDRYAHSLTADDERAAQVISDQVGPAFQRLHETGIE